MAVTKVSDNKTLPAVVKVTSGGVPKVFKVSALSKVF